MKQVFDMVDDYEKDLAEKRARISTLRKALLQCARALGGELSDNASDDLLMRVPDVAAEVMATMRATIACNELEVERLKEELSSAYEALAAQEKKFEDCPHPKGPEYWPCACSYDKPSHVCMIHAPQLKAALAEIASFKAQLATLEWKPITPDWLPNRRDEALQLPTDTHGARVIPVGFDARDGDEVRYLESGFTHYRPINPPQAATEGQ